MHPSPNRIAGLYAIADTHYLSEARVAPAVEQALAGGARVIQYRDKQQTSEQRLRQAVALAALCRRRDAVFLINDDVELAERCGADGVHVGREDASLAQARARLGPRAIVGVSCYNELARAETAQADGADYVAFGRFFPSRTKPRAVPAELELLRAAKRQLAIPIVAIGGITPDNGAALLAAGADALAVIEGVFGQADIRAAAERYTNLFKNTETGFTD